MPTTLIGLLIFVVLLMPGFAFVLRRERHTKAERRLSVFRETVAIAFTSVVADAAVIGLFYIISRLFPRITPDLNRMMQEPTLYFRENYWDILGWGAALLTVATAGAFTAASPRLAGFFFNPFLSAWGIMFSQHEGEEIDIYVGCTLADGSYVGGYLLSYSRLSDDLPDREMTLTGEITYRAGESDDAATLANVGGVVVSARNIVMMTVTYVERGDTSVSNGGTDRTSGETPEGNDAPGDATTG